MTNIDIFDSVSDEPSKHTLQLIERMPIRYMSDLKGVLDFVKEQWCYPEYATVSEDGGTYTFRTGGWSGNEALISAMEMNIVFWSMCWYMSQRGGLHVFKLRETE